MNIPNVPYQFCVFQPVQLLLWALVYYMLAFSGISVFFPLLDWFWSLRTGTCFLIFFKSLVESFFFLYCCSCCRERSNIVLVHYLEIKVRFHLVTLIFCSFPSVEITSFHDVVSWMIENVCVSYFLEIAAGKIVCK